MKLEKLTLKHLSFILFIVAFFASCVSRKEYNYRVTSKKYSPELLKKDLSTIKYALEEAHPGVYWYISKDNLDAKFDSLSSALTQPLTLKEFYKKAQPLVTAIRCGHTSLMVLEPVMSKKELKKRMAKGKSLLSQVEYKMINGGLFIIKNPTPDTLLKPGMELMAIDHQPVSKLIDTLKTLFSGDGYNTTFHASNIEKNFYSWYRLLNEKSDSLLLTIRDNGIENDKLYIRHLNNETANETKTIDFSRIKLPKYKGVDEHNNPVLSLSYPLKDYSVAVMKIKSFAFNYSNFTKFYRESFAELKKNKVANLVLDLRYNGGGRLSVSRKLYSYLISKPYVFLGESYAKKRTFYTSMGTGFKIKYFIRSIFTFKYAGKQGYAVKLKGQQTLKPLPNHFDGNLQVLINGYTFSASTLLAANLKASHRATFIGEETGGGFNRCTAGQLPFVELPTTKLMLRLPLFSITPNAKTELIGHGIMPEILIKPNIESFKNGKDPELDTALKNISNRIGYY